MDVYRTWNVGAHDKVNIVIKQSSHECNERGLYRTSL